MDWRQALTVVTGFFAMVVAPARAALVWQSTFDSSADGVVDVRNNNPLKVMIGSVSGGRLSIVAQSKSTTPSDKAGRSVGETPVGYLNSMGALYAFRWTGLPAGGSSGETADQIAGFVSGSSEHSTRQFLGVRLRHRRNASNDNLVSMGISWASEGHTSVGLVLQPGEVNLGQTAAATTLELRLAIGYDSANKNLRAALYNAANSKLREVQLPIDQMPSLGAPPGSAPVQSELNALALTHLGWSDAVGPATFQNITWSIDSLRYYDDAVSPFNDVGPEPIGACCQLNGTCAQTTLFNCNYQWHGAGVSCDSVSCIAPLAACCDPFGTCTDATLNGCAHAWQGPGTACATFTCQPIGACCRGDGTCAEGVTENGCAGLWQGAGSLCATSDCIAAVSGACCHADGTCTSARVEDCHNGEWQGLGTNCGSATCPVSPSGACCQLDGTCALARQAECLGAWQGEGTTCASANCAAIPDPVWLSTFDTTADGVVNVWDANPAKAMIGANTGGEQNIITMSQGTTAPHDRAGRALPSPRGAGDSFGGLYKFRYIAYPVATPPTAGVQELAGFVTAGASPGAQHSTRLFLTSAWVHNLTGGQYNTQFGIRWGSLGFVNTGRTFTNVSFGNMPPVGRNFLLAIGYHGPSKNCFVGLYRAIDRSTLAVHGGDIRTYDNLGVPPDDPALQQELNALTLSHLGWSDFIADPVTDGVTRTWAVDALAYFDSTAGAFQAIGVPSPFIGACCHADGSCADSVPIEQCDGTFQGSASTCAAVTCPLPPCPNPFADADGDGDVDANDFGAFQRCFSGPNPVQFNRLACHCYDRDNDNDVDLDDFDDFVLCKSGANVPANSACDGLP